MKYILFCGGGSAGHVVPNLAVMNELKYTHRIAYVGTGGIEKRLLAETNFPFFEIDCPKLVRSVCLDNFSIPKRLHRAKKEAIELLTREKPDLVVSKGGYASYPAVYAAHKLKIPVLTHESDLKPGLTTKMIAKKCNFVLTSFPETAGLFPNGRYVGSPMRKELFRSEKGRARRKFQLPPEGKVLLVLGGGSGSRAINEAVHENLSRLLKKYAILHLCGKGNLMEDPPEGYFQREFENDMASAYAACDLVLSRAGSNTVFETIALKKPALLVPLEKNSRGDQLFNALYFEKRHLAKILRESELSALPEALESLEEDKELFKALSESEIKSGTPQILQVIREMLN